MISVKPSPLTITSSRSFNLSLRKRNPRRVVSQIALSVGSVVPVDGTPYCHFSDPAGPLRALVLPSASQVRERFQQAKAFVRQQAGRGITRPRLCHSVSTEPPSAEVGRKIFLHHADIGGERPLNDKCPKVAEKTINKTSQ